MLSKECFVEEKNKCEETVTEGQVSGSLRLGG